MTNAGRRGLCALSLETRWGRYMPFSAVTTWLERDKPIQQEFEQARDIVLANYTDVKDEVEKNIPWRVRGMALVRKPELATMTRWAREWRALPWLGLESLRESLPVALQSLLTGRAACEQELDQQVRSRFVSKTLNSLLSIPLDPPKKRMADPVVVAVGRHLQDLVLLNPFPALGECLTAAAVECCKPYVNRRDQDVVELVNKVRQVVVGEQQSGV